MLNEEKRAYQRAWYRRHRAQRIAAVKAVKEANRRLLVSLKDRCQKCGYDRCKEALEFHHPNDDKVMCLSDMIKRGWGRDRILTEAKKCRVLCANCHREEEYGVEGIG